MCWGNICIGLVNEFMYVHHIMFADELGWQNVAKIICKIIFPKNPKYLDFDLNSDRWLCVAGKILKNIKAESVLENHQSGVFL